MHCFCVESSLSSRGKRYRRDHPSRRKSTLFCRVWREGSRAVRDLIVDLGTRFLSTKGELNATRGIGPWETHGTLHCLFNLILRLVNCEWRSLAKKGTLLVFQYKSRRGSRLPMESIRRFLDWIFYLQRDTYFLRVLQLYFGPISEISSNSLLRAFYLFHNGLFLPFWRNDYAKWQIDVCRNRGTKDLGLAFALVLRIQNSGKDAKLGHNTPLSRQVIIIGSPLSDCQQLV